MKVDGVEATKFCCKRFLFHATFINDFLQANFLYEAKIKCPEVWATRQASTVHGKREKSSLLQ